MTRIFGVIRITFHIVNRTRLICSTFQTNFSGGKSERTYSIAMTTPEDNNEPRTKSPLVAPVTATKSVENLSSNDAAITSQAESIDNSDPKVKQELTNDANESIPLSISVTAARPPPIPKSVPNLLAVAAVQGVVTKVPKKEPSPITLSKSSPVTNTETGTLGTTNRPSSIAMPARKKSSTGMSTNPSSPIPSQQPQIPSGDMFSVDVVEKSMSKIADGLRKKLKDLENEIDKDEEQYMSKTWAHGNIMRGWDGFIRRVDRVEKQPTGNGAGVGTGAPKTRKPRLNDRFLSLSSATSKYRKDNPEVFIQKRGVMMKKKRKR